MRKCKKCGKILNRRKGEKPSQFNERDYCNRKCYVDSKFIVCKKCGKHTINKANGLCLACYERSPKRKKSRRLRDRKAYYQKMNNLFWVWKERSRNRKRMRVRRTAEKIYYERICKIPGCSNSFRTTRSKRKYCKEHTLYDDPVFETKERKRSLIKNRLKRAMPEYRESERQRALIYLKDLKKRVLSKYTKNIFGIPECRDCGERNIMLLTADHVVSVGNRNNPIRKNLYLWLQRNNYPKGFEVRCYNCNIKKFIKEIAISRKGKYSDRVAAWNLEQKKKVMLHYCDNNLRCQNSNCKTRDIDKLCIDHIEGKGNIHRKQISGSINRWIIKNSYPEGFQVLCHNCNQYKRITGKLPKY